MRRLFSSFAPGAPGIGMLLLRVATGGTAIAHGVAVLLGGVAFPIAVFHVLLILVGALLLAGLWTPIAAIFVTLSAIAEMILRSSLRPELLAMAIMAAAIALLGPGAWSVDARLYGWKQIKIPAGKHEQDSPD
jgi:putative oxidoreductase